MKYDDTYAKHPDYFGDEPGQLLTNNIHLLDKSKPVLDIGAGQGRNTIITAQQGIQVDAIDISQVGVDIINKIASDQNLPINAYRTGFEDFEPEIAPYGAILLFGIIQIISWNDIMILLDRINSWTESGSYVFVSAFTTGDPGYEKIAASSEKAGKNSYRMADGGFRTALEPGEILSIFKNFDAVYHWEGIGPEHRHGGKELHRHASVNALLRKEAK